MGFPVDYARRQQNEALLGPPVFSDANRRSQDGLWLDPSHSRTEISPPRSARRRSGAKASMRMSVSEASEPRVPASALRATAPKTERAVEAARERAVRASWATQIFSLMESIDQLDRQIADFQREGDLLNGNPSLDP